MVLFDNRSNVRPGDGSGHVLANFVEPALSIGRLVCAAGSLFLKSCSRLEFLSCLITAFIGPVTVWFSWPHVLANFVEPLVFLGGVKCSASGFPKLRSRFMLLRLFMTKCFGPVTLWLL